MIFTLEGNIGAGKTTFLAKLDAALADAGIPHKVLYEPVGEWMETRIGGRSMLELFYADKARHGFVFQMFVLQTRVTQMLACLEENPGTVIVTERCHITDCEIFAKMLADAGMLTPAEMHVYRSWYDMCSAALDRHLKGILYLRATPPVCMGRIARRNRPGEEGMDGAYVAELHRAHEDWIAPAAGGRGVPAVTIDADVDEPLVDAGQAVAFIRREMHPQGAGPSADGRRTPELLRLGAFDLRAAASSCH
jgi:deoxyadenosine/deoxycytidine kinase